MRSGWVGRGTKSRLKKMSFLAMEMMMMSTTGTWRRVTHRKRGTGRGRSDLHSLPLLIPKFVRF